MAKVAFESKAPAKLPALLWCIILIRFPAPAVFAGTWGAWLLGVPCIGLAGVLLLSVFAPGLFLSGVRLFPGGFDFRSPMRAPRTIQYEDIRQIDVVVARDGDMGLTFVDLVVRSERDRMRLQESLLVESGLLAQLEALPRFTSLACAQALQYVLTGRTELFAKRFRVFNAT